MKNSYLCEKEIMSQCTDKVGSTIPVKLMAFILFSMAFLGLIGCGGDVQRVLDAITDNMEITPPSGEGGGGVAETTVWPCPFGNNGSITVPRLPFEDPDAVIRFQGNSCGNFWVSAGYGSPGYSDYGAGHVHFWNGGTYPPGIHFINDNNSGQTIIRQYTAYFCSKSDVNNPAFCGPGQARGTGTFTVRWL